MKKSAAIAALVVAMTCWQTPIALTKTKTIINITVIDRDDPKIGVISAVLSGTAGLQQEATTDLNGKVRLERECKAGEQIQANPIEEIVYEPSAPVACNATLEIKVRRRPFATSGVVVFSLADYKELSGEDRLAITKVGLIIRVKDIKATSNSPAFCQVAMQPTVETVVYGTAGSDKVKMIAELLSPADGSIGSPQIVNLGTLCEDSTEAINQYKAAYAKDVTSVAVAEGIGSKQWVAESYHKNPAFPPPSMMSGGEDQQVCVLYPYLCN